ncbi:uncharacterized protein F5891DRAFT_700163 [Suillus fuscotomentosus]|uniref:Uncharacterized protein n=1 Tax=Suillus fuscotomentosus TaxID=1912939 RepID=A0AAD4DVJ9_9AGAM|nr:uncharacterized protein F5891DRAFT_700163 [Suillus fuscotomentosus]KAG1894923.1 hypothetical protein F5891DRAFT_700163 [Suillus fuscotomentosus]
MIFPDPSSIPDVLRYLFYLKSLPPADTLFNSRHLNSRLSEELTSTALPMIVRKAGILSGIYAEPLSTLYWAKRYTRYAYSMLVFSVHASQTRSGTNTTHLLTRAFPSTLLSRSPTLQTTSSTYPFMLPGVDVLSHSRGQPVSCCTSYPEVRKKGMSRLLFLSSRIPRRLLAKKCSIPTQSE